MSTRANIIVKDSYNKLYFYRHSDGYPKGAMPTIERFMKAIQNGPLRRDPSQAGGWLIIFGADEPEYKLEQITDLSWWSPKSNETDEVILKKWEGYIPSKPEKEWKVGAIEPTDQIHGDIEYLYECDLEKMEVKIYKTPFDFKTKGLKPKLVETRSFAKQKI